MKNIARVLGMLTDLTRLRLLRLLCQQELCVCELVDTLRMPQYKISRHLRSLRAVGLVEARRDGRWMHYRLGAVAHRLAWCRTSSQCCAATWIRHHSVNGTTPAYGVGWSRERSGGV